MQLLISSASKEKRKAILAYLVDAFISRFKLSYYVSINTRTIFKESLGFHTQKEKWKKWNRIIAP